MFKVIIACEGQTERDVINYLLDNDLLVYKRSDLLDEKPHVLRQPNKLSHIINLLPADTKLIFCRIGDTQKDAFDYSCLRQKDIEEYRYCTKPEIEILGIIKADKFSEYSKTKLRPKAFFKDLSLGNFIRYICQNNISDILFQYKHLKRHKSGELYLVDLLKEKRNG